ncbi:MAG: hypothetical protein ACRCS9_03690 [Hyphomicrobium sp.]
MSDSFLIRLAAGLLGRERAEALPEPGLNDRAWQLARNALAAAKLSDTVVFFLDDTVVMHYGSTVAATHSTVRSRSTGERIRGVNEVVGTTASLTADSLRNIFALVELLAFKLVHIQHERQRPDYDQQTEGHRKRLRRLRDKGAIDLTAFVLLDELYGTRCEFAHTVQGLESLSYRGKPLRCTFGARGGSRDDAVRDFFLDDMFAASEALLAAFRPMQWLQLDAEAFERAWRNMALTYSAN